MTKWNHDSCYFWSCTGHHLWCTVSFIKKEQALDTQIKCQIYCSFWRTNYFLNFCFYSSPTLLVYGETNLRKPFSKTKKNCWHSYLGLRFQDGEALPTCQRRMKNDTFNSYYYRDSKQISYNIFLDLFPFKNRIWLLTIIIIKGRP